MILATTDLKEGKIAEAEKTFREVYAQKPGNFDAINGLATALLAQTSKEKIQQGLELARVNAKAYRDIRTAEGRQSVALLAWGLYQNGSTAEANQLMQSVVVSGEISPEIGYYAAQIFKKSQNAELAKQILSKTLENKTQFVHRADAENC